MRRALDLRAAGVPAAPVALLVGAGGSTIRRWCARARRDQPLIQRRGPLPGIPDRADPNAQAVETLVRETHGLMGAAALSRAVPGLSRRQAAIVKAWTVTTMERERKAAQARVQVTAPGILRGFDAMNVAATDGLRRLLCAGDAAVPYTTSVVVSQRYDAPAIAAALDADFAQHGPPLVLRQDRWRAHDAPPVRQVCLDHQVLVLHGPPHHPRYYGQLERQNRDRRAWLNLLGCRHTGELVSECERMRVRLNSSWPRRTLAWHTPEELWNRRPAITVDRSELAAEVGDLQAHLDQTLTAPPYAGFTERLAIEAALTRHGFLHRVEGGGC